MEETVGKLWHRFITRAAGGHFPQAAVRLKEIERMTGVFFRALGGDPGLRVAAATADVPGARRSLLSRIAGSDERTARARMDAVTLRLPMELDALPERSLNRDLYLWLAALAAASGAPAGAEDEAALAEAQTRLAPLPEGASADAATLELRLNQLATLRALLRWPGLQPRYERLVAAVIQQRIEPARLPPVEAERENLIRQALQQPGSVAALPPLPPKGMPNQPVLLWLGDLMPGEAATARGGRGAEASANAQNKRDERETERQAHRVERVDQPQEKHGLLMIFRAESLLSVAEFLKVKRSTDDDPDDNAADAAANLEQLALSRDEERVASKVRFDLDLPSAAEDDVVLGDGIRCRNGTTARACCARTTSACRNSPPRHTTRAPRRRRCRPTCTALRTTCTASLPRCSPAGAGSRAASTAASSTSTRWCAPPPTAPSASIRPTSSTCRWKSANATSPAWRWPTCRCPPMPGFRRRRASSTSSAIRCCCSAKRCRPPATASRCAASPRSSAATSASTT